jgi:hydrogenase maturation protease
MPALQTPTPLPTLVIGCGNPLCGDDAAGVEVVRLLAAQPLPPHVRCLDAGTSGLEVTLAMRTAGCILLIDAAKASEASHACPGTIHELAPEQLPSTHKPPTAGLSIHTIRWDHALALATALAAEHPLPPVRCYLIEGSSFDYAAPLSPAVAGAAQRLAEHLFQSLGGGDAPG